MHSEGGAGGARDSTGGNTGGNTGENTGENAGGTRIPGANAGSPGPPCDRRGPRPPGPTWPYLAVLPHHSDHATQHGKVRDVAADDHATVRIVGRLKTAGRSCGAV